MSELLLKITNITIDYNGKHALSCPDLHIFNDDFIGIIGPNGGGKTTLLKALLKSIPYQGEVAYGRSLAPKSGTRIGYLPQVQSIDRSFPVDVYDTVLSGLQAEKGIRHRYNTRQDRKRVEGILDFTGIKSLKNRAICDISGGEFQRVMFCRALISDPLLLILDEPDNFLDSTFKQDLYRMLPQLNARMAILLVSHNPEAIKNLVKTTWHVDRTVTIQDR